MHILYDEVGMEKLVDGWNEGFEANLSQEEMKALTSQIQRFNAFFVDVYKGEEIVLDYRPGQGTTVQIAGEVKGNIEGPAFNRALLSIWLGEEPVSADLRQELLANAYN